MSKGRTEPLDSSLITHRSSLPPPPGVCPVCGADVPPGALACPECGADAETGWNEEATATDGLDLPDNDFNYDEFVKREFAEEMAPGGWRRQMLWIAAGLIAALVGTVIWNATRK
jgi:hypothetical protein